MNILFAISSSEVGGAQKWVMDQISLVRPYVSSVHIATNKKGWLTDSSGSVPLFLDPGINLYCSPIYLFALNRYIKKNDIDLIVASSASAGVYARLASLFTSLKVVYVSHGWSSIYNGGFLSGLFIRAEKILSYCTDKVLCVSDSDRVSAIDVIGINPDKITTISNGVFPVSCSAPYSGYDTPGRFKVLFVLRLAAPKRIDLIIDLVSYFKDSDIDFHVVGDGPMMSHIKEFKQDNNVRLYLHGEKRGFSNFEQFDVFVLLSDSEGLPMSALEALSAGLPLILSDVGGCSQLIDGNGFLVSNNISEVTDALFRITSDIDEYSSRSIEIFNSKFNIEYKRSQYLKLYRVDDIRE